MESLLALARASGDDGSREALKGAAPDSAAMAFARDFEHVLGELNGARPDLDAMELQLRGNALAGSAAVCRAVLESKDANLSAPDCPECGRPMKRRCRKVPKTFLTRVREVTLRRSHCHCRRCGKGKVPLDGFLGLEGTSMSPGAERMIAEVAVEAPTRKSVGLLKGLAGLDVDRTRLWSKADGLGADAARFERERVDAVGAAPDRIYASIDGTGVPMRKDALEGCAGKGEDGEAGTARRSLSGSTRWRLAGRPATRRS